jgi:hypothetical protein
LWHQKCVQTLLNDPWRAKPTLAENHCRKNLNTFPDPDFFFVFPKPFILCPFENNYLIILANNANNEILMEATWINKRFP